MECANANVIHETKACRCALFVAKAKFVSNVQFAEEWKGRY